MNENDGSRQAALTASLHRAAPCVEALEIGFHSRTVGVAGNWRDDEAGIEMLLPKLCGLDPRL